MTVKMYTLSTCGHCKAAKQFMGDHAVAHEFTDVDLLAGDARKSKHAAQIRAAAEKAGITMTNVVIGSPDGSIGGGLTDAARRALLQHLQSPALRGDKFVFSSEEFGKHIRFRSVSISNGAVLTAPVNRFEECFTKRSVNEAQGEYEFTTRGRVTDQRLKSSAR